MSVKNKICFFVLCLFLTNVPCAFGEVLSVQQMSEKLRLAHSNNKVERLAAQLFLAEYFLDEDPEQSLNFLSQARALGFDYSQSMILYFEIKAYSKMKRHDEVIKLAGEILPKSISKRWRKDIFEQAINSAYLSEDYQKIITFFDQYRNFLSVKKHSHQTLKYVAIAYDKMEIQKNYIEVLEALASFAPDTDDAVWALSRLREYSCAGQYSFSVRLLKHLSWNSKVHPGLKQYIIALLHTPLRVDGDEAKHLSPFEIARQLESYRYFVEAKTDYEAILYMQESTLHQKMKSLYQLGQIYIKLGRPEQAEKKFRSLRKKYPTYRSNRVKSWLADSMRYQGRFDEAANVYSSIKDKSDPYLNWQTFWVLYRSGNYQKALEMMEDEALDFDRDKNGSSLRQHWLAKIYNKIGKEPKAKAQLKKMHRTNVDGYYSAINIFKDPTYLSKVVDHLQDKRLADTLIPTRDLQVIDSKGAQIIFSQYLTSHKMFESVATLFNDSKKVLKKYDSNPQDILKIHTTFSTANYYTPQRSWLSATGFRKNRYKGIDEKVESQQREIENWKLFYPMAYQDYTKGFASDYNIDPYALLSIMRAESYYREHARSNVGARGLLQIMPFTGIRIAKDLGDGSLEFESLIEPKKTIQYGSFYFSKLYQAYDENLYVALAAYNAGPSIVNSWLKSCQKCTPDEFIESIPYRETRRYVKKISRFLLNYQLLYKPGEIRKNWPIISNKIPSLDGLY